MTTLAVTERRAGWLVEAPEYRLDVSSVRPRALLADPDGTVWSDLSLVASAHRVDLPHENVAPAGDAPYAPRLVGRADDAVVFEVPSVASAWDDAVVELRCTLDAVRLRVRVRGVGRLGDVTLGGGLAVFGNGAAGEFRSGIAFRSLFVPVPTEPVHVVRAAAASAQLGVVGDAEPGRLHGIFSPPPLVLGFGRGGAGTGALVPDDPAPEHGRRPWLAAAVVAPVEECGFTAVRYEPLDGGWLLRLAYEGHTVVDGEWVSPELVLTAVGSPWAAIEAYVREVAGVSPAPARGPVPDWWLQPLFCGWGAQCATAAAISRAGGVDEKAEATLAAGFVVTAGAATAPALARQSLYDRWLARLAEHGVVPGTVVIDDRWQAEYGTCEPDPEKWPDLRAWIADRHAAGQRVLLWFKAWDPSGLPPAECVTDAIGRPIAVDPANPAYLARLRAIVTRLLSPQGLDADGFKVDFTQRTPSGATLRTAADGARPAWGVAGLHRLMATVHAAAKAAKPDALIVNHTVNPLFAGVTDMVRLNDVLEHDPEGSRAPVADQLAFRAAVARAALPGHPVDTDQWPMPDRAEWLAYTAAQPDVGVPALYYVESIDNSGEEVTGADLGAVTAVWAGYRDRMGLDTPAPVSRAGRDEDTRDDAGTWHDAGTRP